MHVRWIEKATYGLGLVTVVLSLGTRLFAITTVAAPEIDAQLAVRGPWAARGGRPDRAIADAVEVVKTIRTEGIHMRSQLVHAVWYGIGVVAMVLAIQGQAHAGLPTDAPEIDGSTLSAGFGLLAAGVLIVRARMRSK